MPTSFTEEDYRRMCELHAQGLTSREVGALMGCGHATVLRAWHRNNCDVNASPSHRTHPLDEQFFDVIDTEEKAYWLGFITADGNINRSRADMYCLTINLAAIDEGHLRKFAAALKTTIPVRTIRDGQMVNFNVYSRHLVTALEALGVCPAKAHIIKPYDVPTDLQRHYWRGIFDGDGCIAHYPKMGWIMHLAGSDAVVHGFRDVTRDITQARATPRQGKTGTWNYQISGRNVSRPLARWLYEDATVFLDRKLVCAQRLLSDEFALRPLPANKLTLDAIQIREQYEQGASTPELAKQYAVSSTAIASIIKSVEGILRTPAQGRELKRRQRMGIKND